MSPRKVRLDIRQMGQRILTAYLALLVANVLVYAVLVRPRARTHANLATERASLLERFRQREAEVTGRESFLAALDKAKSDLEKMRQDILSTRERRMIDVQLELARLSRQFSINMQRVRYENEGLEDEGLERFAMVVPLSGGYGNLRKFLQAVEESSKFLVIEQVALATGPEGGAILELNITLATYFDDPASRASRATRRRVPGRA